MVICCLYTVNHDLVWIKLLRTNNIVWGNHIWWIVVRGLTWGLLCPEERLWVAYVRPNVRQRVGPPCCARSSYLYGVCKQGTYDWRCNSGVDVQYSSVSGADLRHLWDAGSHTITNVCTKSALPSDFPQYARHLRTLREEWGRVEDNHLSELL